MRKDDLTFERSLIASRKFSIIHFLAAGFRFLPDRQAGGRRVVSVSEPVEPLCSTHSLACLEDGIGNSPSMVSPRVVMASETIDSCSSRFLSHSQSMDAAKLGE